MQPVLNVCPFSLGSFTLLPCCLKGKKKNQEREHAECLPDLLLNDGFAP